MTNTDWELHPAYLDLRKDIQKVSLEMVVGARLTRP